MKGKDNVEKIVAFALLLGAESDKQIEEYDKFNNHIEPLFLKRFGHSYDPSLRGMYQGEKQEFLKEQSKLLNS